MESAKACALLICRGIPGRFTDQPVCCEIIAWHDEDHIAGNVVALALRHNITIGNTGL